MRHFIIASGLAALLAFDARAQNTNLAFIPGKLAVYAGRGRHNNHCPTTGSIPLS